MNRTASLIAGFSLLALGLSHASAEPLPRHKPVPGGVVLLPLGETGFQPGDEIHFNSRTAMVRKVNGEWVAVLGIPLALGPGRHYAELRQAGGDTRRVHFEIEDKQYAEQRLTVERRMVHPSAEELERIGRDSGRIRAALDTWTAELKIDSMAFPYPVEGPRSSPFGLRRFFNDEARRPHSGLDIAVPTGTPITAPASGRVVETGDYYFNGKTVFIHHGQGLVTMYCHMDSIDVEADDWVEPGKIIGTVGATGRVTGPHLHWSVSLNGTMVDPDLFLAEP